MKNRMIAVLAATVMSATLFAQQPGQMAPGGPGGPRGAAPDLPEGVREKLSYQQGYSLGQQLAAQVSEEHQALFLRGFNEALAQEADEDMMIYASGAQSAMQAQQQGASVGELLRGIEDVLEGRESAYTEEEVMEAFQQIQQLQQQQQQQQQHQQQAREQQAEENLREGEAFLQENAARGDVVTTLSGLQYEVLEEGEGGKPSPEDTVQVHYTGRLLDGTVFDSSVERGEPVEFPLNQVIPGWTEGVQLMSPGARYEFWIPSDLAYGEQAPPQIGPNQVLHFEVELLEILED